VKEELLVSRRVGWDLGRRGGVDIPNLLPLLLLLLLLLLSLLLGLLLLLLLLLLRDGAGRLDAIIR